MQVSTTSEYRKHSQHTKRSTHIFCDMHTTHRLINLRHQQAFSKTFHPKAQCICGCPHCFCWENLTIKTTELTNLYMNGKTTISASLPVSFCFLSSFLVYVVLLQNLPLLQSNTAFCNKEVSSLLCQSQVKPGWPRNILNNSLRLMHTNEIHTNVNAYLHQHTCTASSI